MSNSIDSASSNRQSMPILTEQESSAPTMPYCTTQLRCRARQPHRVILIPGDGIGPEVAEATARAVEATGIALEWERVELNGNTIAECGGLVPSAVLEAMGHIPITLQSPVSAPV